MVLQEFFNVIMAESLITNFSNKWRSSGQDLNWCTAGPGTPVPREVLNDPMLRSVNIYELGEEIMMAAQTGHMV